MKLVEFKTVEDKTIYINPELVESIKVVGYGNNGAIVVMNSGESIHLNEPIKDVALSLTYGKNVRG